MNLTKYIFGIPSGILLGNIISYHGNPREDHGGDQYEAADLRQGRLEANRMHGGFKSFHIPIRRKGFAVLQAAQIFREVYLDT